VCKVSLCRYDFVVKLIKKDVGKLKIVRSEEKGCHMSQEIVIKFRVA